VAAIDRPFAELQLFNLGNSRTVDLNRYALSTHILPSDRVLLLTLLSRSHLCAHDRILASSRSWKMPWERRP
jgi:hypothetical protein